MTRVLPPQSATQSREGWQAELELGYGWRNDRTKVVHRKQRGPLSVQRPFHPEEGVCHTYLLHPPGGVVGGDQLTVTVNAQMDAHALITTPGATKFYRSGGRHAQVQQVFDVEPQGVLEWLPLENIFFSGADASLATEINIAPGGRFLGWEMHCFGRPVLNEGFTAGRVTAHTRILLDGEVRLIDQLKLEAGEGGKPTGLRGYAMFASLIAAPAGECELEQVHDWLAANPLAAEQGVIGATLVDGVLVVRALADMTEILMAQLVPIWALLRQNWLEVAPCPPRIWAT